MVRKILKYLSITALMLAMVACDRDDDDDVPDMEPGTFEAAISGDVESTLEGSAIFTEYVHEMTGEYFFTLGMSAAVEENVSIWFVRSGQFPGDGSYTIQPFDLDEMDEELWFFEVDQFINFNIREVNQQSELYFAESGTITMELVDDDTAIAGDFEFAATGSVMGQEGEVTPVEVQFSGSFYAVFGTVQFPEFTFNQGQ